MAKSPSQKFRNNIHTKKTGPRSHHKAEELVWGIHPVEEALKACPHAIREIIIAKDKPGNRLEEILELAQKHAIPVSSLPGTPKTGYGKPDERPEHKSSQGVSARIILPTLTLHELLDKLKDVSVPPLLLALDSIQDPHNLGAIIRSAVAAGVKGIIIPKDRSASITGTVIKISAGSVFQIDICWVTNLVNSFKILKENGIWIFGTAKDASQHIYDADLTGPVCLVIGGEGKGLRPLVADHCDLNIAIPMHSSLDSLNASVAAGIILFEIVRQRRAQYR
jgi:23S rRNA (guanosine2251-2'-O)-methyltransferase